MERVCFIDSPSCNYCKYCIITAREQWENPLRSLWLSIGRAQPIGLGLSENAGKASLFIQASFYCYLELWRSGGSKDWRGTDGVALAWRWFTGLGFDQELPHHSTFSKNRHGRFQESKLFEELFEQTVKQCVEVGLVRGKPLSVDGSFVRIGIVICQHKTLRSATSELRHPLRLVSWSASRPRMPKQRIAATANYGAQMRSGRN